MSQAEAAADAAQVAPVYSPASVGPEYQRYDDLPRDRERDRSSSPARNRIRVSRVHGNDVVIKKPQPQSQPTRDIGIGWDGSKLTVERVAYLNWKLPLRQFVNIISLLIFSFFILVWGRELLLYRAGAESTSPVLAAGMLAFSLVGAIVNLGIELV